MKRDSFDHDEYMRSQMSSYSPSASYESAMKVYKSFAYASAGVLTAVCLISQIL